MKVCVIPARGGSKRIPRKNIKHFCGQPIIAYPIQAALASGLFDHVVVSTDDDEIAKIALQYGAAVPFKRPIGLADDYTATAPVLLHALEWFEHQALNVAEIICLYPTTPFLTAQLLQTAYQTWKESRAEYCFSVSEYPSAPQRAMLRDPQGKMSSLYPQFDLIRTQDLMPTFFDVGQFYFCEAVSFKTDPNLHSPKALGYELPKLLAIDIDTPDDWRLAELIYQAQAMANLSTNEPVSQPVNESAL